MEKRLTNKKFLARAKKLGYITFEQMMRESLKNKKFRELWESGAAERAIRIGIIRKRIEK